MGEYILTGRLNLNEQAQEILKIAEKHGVTMTQVALSWLLQKPLLAAPVVGVTKVSHLEDAVKAVDVMLTAPGTYTPSRV